ncbi:uncharacterized protein LOC122250320 [Penaeus japonicus]|uniref:uncharacterized protein LOC122250320 n=1 Tax=Penaeus japonicus TaxID=27405 RepID=UPI001C70B567|nr:uncharacterized protein LOC122250320 [Penaeus japonicus]XP_042867628.1 uncharacterized protein LOC122250320 [Penaeus japonicus]
MAVENTIDDEAANTQGRKDVSGLISSLESLQIKDSSQNNVPELEESFSQINLDSRKDTKRNSLHLLENNDGENSALSKKEEEEKEEVAKESDGLLEVKETITLKEEKEEAEDKETGKSCAEDGEEEEKDTEAEKPCADDLDDEEKESTEKVDQKKKLSDEHSEEKEPSVKPKNGAKDDKIDSSGVKTEETASEAEDESEDEESSDENYSEVVILSRKKTSDKRGPCVRGPGVQSMQSCMIYTGQPFGLDNYDVSANSYNFQPVQHIPQGYVPYKSPLYASSPGYTDNCLPDQTDTRYIMDSPPYQPNMSPASSAIETFLPSPVSSGGYYQNEFDVTSPGQGISQGYFELPDTPKSQWDESELTQMPVSFVGQTSEFGQLQENQHFMSEPKKDMDLMGSLLEIIHRDRNNPQSSHVPGENLVEIIKDLRSCELAGMPNFSNFGNNLEEMLEVASHLNNTVQVSDNSVPHYQNLFASRSAEKEIKEHLDQHKLKSARMRVAVITNEDLVQKDVEGDTPPMIVACTDVKSLSYYENLVAVIERQQYINVCCDQPVNKVSKSCSNCLSNNHTSFYSSLAMKNNSGDTILNCVIKLKYPEKVINYICENLMDRSADILRVFDSTSISYYVKHTEEYPVLKQMIHVAQEMRCNPNFMPWTCSQ